MPVLPNSGNYQPTHAVVRLVQITEAQEGQRLDNFLIKYCKGVPKSHLYKAVRAGQVRVNRGRCGVDYRLKLGDEVRVPPFRMTSTEPKAAPPAKFPVVYEDDSILVINKPAAVAVHGGSGISHGVIESLRSANPGLDFLELVHRLDRETSGLLMLAKRRQALVRLHAMIREGKIRKLYVALVQGRLENDRQHIKLPLTKWLTSSGERRVKVDEQGQAAHTIVNCIERFRNTSLALAELRTGRTHQIRVHLASSGHPIVGDTKYGSDQLQQWWRDHGIKRMMLHARTLAFDHPMTGQRMELQADVPVEFERGARLLADSDRELA